MKWFVEWWRKREERKRKEKEEYNRESVILKATELFQVCEHDSQIWFTYDGRLVCPMSMFEEKNPVVALGVMRDLYVKENQGK